MSWKVERLWQEEWPCYKPALRRLRLALQGKWKQGHGDGTYWAELQGAYVDAIGYFFVCFKYTLAHVFIPAPFVIIGGLVWLVISLIW